MSVELILADTSSMRPDFEVTMRPNNVVVDTEFSNRYQAASNVVILYPKDDGERESEISDVSYQLPYQSLDLIYHHLSKMGLSCTKQIVPFDSWYRQKMLYIQFPTIDKADTYLRDLVEQGLITYSSLVIIPGNFEIKSAFGSAKYTVDFKVYDLYQNQTWSYNIVVNAGIIRHGKPFDVKLDQKDALDNIFPTYHYNTSYNYARIGDFANWSEQDFKQYANEEGLQAFEGIYQRDGQRYFIKKHDEDYVIVACGRNSYYIDGDIRGNLEGTATKNIFFGEWNPYGRYDVYKSCTCIFDNIGLTIQSKNMTSPIQLIKVWPKATE